MPRISLWRDGAHSADYKFIDKVISEQFTVGGTGINLHKYLGPIAQGATGDATQPNYANQSEQNIQDLLFLENRDRKYETDIYTMRGIYQMSDSDFDLSQFGLFLSNGTIQVHFHLNDMVQSIGRKIMAGDVIEMMHLKDYNSLDSTVPVALKRYYVVSDAKWPTEGFSPTWWPHLWRVKCNPLVDSQEYKDILNNIMASEGVEGGNINGNAASIGQVLTNLNTLLNINDAIITQAETDVPKSGYNTEGLYSLPIKDGKPGDPRIDLPERKVTAYLGADGLPPNGSAFEAGITFPANPALGLYFLRVDFTPNRLFKYDGARWVKIEDAVRTNITPGNPNNMTLKNSFVNPTF